MWGEIVSKLPGEKLVVVETILRFESTSDPGCTNAPSLVGVDVRLGSTIVPPLLVA